MAAAGKVSGEDDSIDDDDHSAIDDLKEGEDLMPEAKNVVDEDLLKE